MNTDRTGLGRSRLGGVPVVIPTDDMHDGPRQLVLTTPRVPERRQWSALPGVVHVHGWLDAATQASLAANFREWARPPAGLRHPRVPHGHVMSIQSVCLGWHWSPYAYSRTADDTDGTPVKPMPGHVAALARDAVAAAYGTAGDFAPDAAIVNFYPPGARLGLHQDGEEPCAAPVVTISLGDTCVFRLAGVERRTSPFTDITLESGDLLVFGGPSRRIFHGVPRVLAATAPDGLGLPPGRLSLTVRETGLRPGMTAVVDGSRLELELDDLGVADAGVLLDASTCRDIVALYDDDDRFRSTIDMARHRFGQGQYRYFDHPLPPVVTELRRALWPRLLPIAREWAHRLRRPAPWPDVLDDWLERCHRAGQTRPTPLLLRYGPGDWNTLHRDLYGDLVFPLQVVIGLDEPRVDYTGGELVVVEQRPHAQSRTTCITVEHGHGIVFTTRDRPVLGTRGWSAAPTRHGVSVVRSGRRHTLGILFHDAA